MANTPLSRERVIVSARLIVPTSCCGGFNEKAVRFRKSINASTSTGRLQAEIAAKTITDGFGIRVKAYEDTDGKKREFSADSRPGVKTNDFGYRWEGAATWEPGSRLVISPSFQSREGMGTEPNVGWIKPDKNQTTSFEEMLQLYRAKPQIKLSKYKVNPKTDEVIPDSEKVIDPFNMAAGLSSEERQKALRKYKNDLVEQKMLPGRSLESRVPGGSLLSRAAAVFGILRDENNKFRCPPGTPAANQFTDATGSNCFGFSPSKFVRFAARQAAKLEAEGRYEGLRQNARTFFNFLYNDQYGAEARGVADPVLLGRSAFWESVSGDRFKPPAWRDIPVPENLRLFKNGAIRGQDDIARQKADVARIVESLGIDPSDPDASLKAAQALRKMWEDSGGTAGWDLTVVNVSGGGSGPLTDLEIKRFMEVRLQSLAGWGDLSKEEQDRLLLSDIGRYKETQKALFDSLLDQFMKDPASMRGIGTIEFNFNTTDEAGTSVYRDAPSIVPRLNPDGSPVLDKDGNPVMKRIPGELRTAIHVNMGMILSNQETMLPDMRPDERLAISAVGARSEAEGRLAVADFLINADYTARGMAGLLDGVYGFTSHIMLHETAHHKQAQLFIEKIQDEIADKGFIEIPIIKDGVVVGARNVDSIYKLNGDDIMAIMTDTADSINIDALNDAMERIKAIAPLAGAYPRDGYTEGSEVWALEAAAELWALRERGIIYGDDIDAALEWMDNMSFTAAARERASSDDADAALSMDDVFRVPTDSVVPDDMPMEDIEETLADRDARLVSEMREEIKRFKEVFSGLEEDEMFDEAAIIASQRDSAARRLEAIKEIEIDPRLPDEERLTLETLKAEAIKDAQRELDFNSKRYDEAAKAWQRKFGVGARGEKKRFEETVRGIREREGLLDPGEMAELARKADLDDLRERVKSMPEKKIVRRIADDEVRLSTLDPASDEFRKLADELEVVRDQYVENLKSAGDKRTKSQIKKDLDKKVVDLISPPPKPSKKFKSAKEAADHGAKERRRVKATPEQKAAMKELGDVAQSDVGMLLDPTMQTRAGRAINKRNARLKRLGLEIDPKSSAEGDVAQQVEHLLIPTMEAIDGTSVGDPFEMEAIIEFAPGALKGKMDGKEVDVDQFVSGRVITSRTKKTDMPERGKRDPKTGRTSRRVVLQVREGDRGLFPTTGGDSEQKFVAPPGRIRIIGRDSDGTIRAEISYQKDAVEVVDSMAASLADNKTDAIWAQSHSKKIKAVADKYVTKRRASGSTFPGPRSDYDDSAVSSSRAVVDDVVDAGGSFGEGFDEVPPHLSSGRTTLSSGKIPNDALGRPETREQRSTSRTSRMSAQIRAVKDVLGGGKGDGSVSRGDIHPEVAQLISELPEETLIDRAQATAYRMHEGFDRRVRVRATDGDIERLSSGAGIRSPFASPADEAPRASRRAERLASMSPEKRSSRSLSSGRIIDSPENYAERRRQEQEVAKAALDIFTDVIDSGQNINDMSDSDIAKKFGGKVKRSARQSISEKDRNLYEVDDIPTAVAMMMLGHHVEVKEQDIRLTEQAQKVFEDEVKNVAKSHIKNGHAKWDAYKAQYMAENPELDFDDPTVVAKMEKDYVGHYQADLCSLYNPKTNLMCSGHIGIDREKMPQTNGRSKGHDTAAIRALKAGRAAGKFEPNKQVTRNEALEKEYEADLAKAIADENAERAAKGKPPLTDEDTPVMLFKVIAKKHSIGNELGGKTAAQHKEQSYDSLSDEAKEWLYQNTNWNDTEVNLETPFINWLNKMVKVSDPENGPAVRRQQRDPGTSAPSQQQLVASKVDGMAQTMQEAAVAKAKEIRENNPGISDEEFRKTFLEEMNKQWFMQPILATKDGFILDGHHRWGALVVANRSLPEELQMPLNVNEVQTDIIEGLTLGKVFQDKWGIKEARLGAERDWEAGSEPGHLGISDITPEEIDAIEADLLENGPRLVDEKYEQGDYIQLGSVGLKNNADYAEAVQARRNLAQTRRPSAAARERERQLDEAIRSADIERSRSLSSGRENVGRLAKLRQSGAARRDQKRNARRADIEKDLQAMYGRQNIGDVTRYHHGLLSQNETDLMIYEDIVENNQPIDMVARRYEISADAVKKAIDRFEMLDSEEKQKLRDRAVDRNAARVSSASQSLSSGKTIGLSGENYAREYYSRIGIPDSVSADTLPVSGYLVHKSHIDAKRKEVMKMRSGNIRPDAIYEIGDEDVVGDGLTAMGDIEIVLRPGVSERVAYGRGNGLSNATRPVKLNSRNREDVADALLNHGGINGDKNSQEAFINMLSASINNDFSNVNASRGAKGQMPNSFDSKLPEGSSREPFEAQILGGFDLSDVEQVNIPFKKLEMAGVKEDISDAVNTKTIADKLRAAGFSPEEIEYFYSIGGGQNLNTESMAMLRNYRAAKKMKTAMGEQGFNNVKFAHPTGFNIEDPRSHSKSAKGGESVESVLMNAISDEIIQAAKDMLKDMKKTRKPRITTMSGGRM